MQLDDLRAACVALTPEEDSAAVATALLRYLEGVGIICHNCRFNVEDFAAALFRYSRARIDETRALRLEAHSGSGYLRTLCWPVSAISVRSEAEKYGPCPACYERFKQTFPSNPLVKPLRRFVTQGSIDLFPFIMQG